MDFAFTSAALPPNRGPRWQAILASIGVHVLVIGSAFLFSKPPNPLDDPSLYKTFIEPEKDRIVWYNFRQDRLPNVGNARADRSITAPNQTVPREIVAHPQADPGRQIVYHEAPKVRLEQDLNAPNIVVQRDVPMPSPLVKQAPKIFSPPAAPKTVAAAQAPRLLEPAPQLQQQASLKDAPGFRNENKAPARPTFQVPQAAQRQTTAPNLNLISPDAAPTLQADLQRMPGVLPTERGKPQPRAFVAPSGIRQERTVPAPKLIAPDAGPTLEANYSAATVAGAQRPMDGPKFGTYVPPAAGAGRASGSGGGTPLVRYETAGSAASVPGGNGQAMEGGDPTATMRGKAWVAPPARQNGSGSSSGTAATIRTTAPPSVGGNSGSSSDKPSSAVAAIIGLHPGDQLITKVPEAQKSAAFGSSPNRGELGGGSKAGAAHIPDVSIGAETRPTAGGAASGNASDANAARELASGKRREPVRVTQPKDGKFSVFVLGSSITDAYAEAAGKLTGKPVYSVYVKVGGKKNWVMQYCLPKDAETHNSKGTFVPVEAPWPVSIVRPFLVVEDGISYVMVKATLGSNGRFEKSDVILPSDFGDKQVLLSSLEQWEFRPAMRDGQAVAVEVLLIVPKEPI